MPTPFALLHELISTMTPPPPLEVRALPSPHYYRGRAGVEVDTIVLHYDVSRKPSALSTARVFASPSRQASAHLCIGDGADDVVQCVSFDDAAWHAGDGGRARMPTSDQLERAGEGVLVPIQAVPPTPKLMARRSIGIEQRNRGYAPRGLHAYATARHRNPDCRALSWETWSDAQMGTIGRVLPMVVAAVPTVRWVVGHEDLTHADTIGDDPSTPKVEREAGGKVDPGPLYRWGDLPLRALGLRRVLYDFERHGWYWRWES